MDPVDLLCRRPAVASGPVNGMSWPSMSYNAAYQVSASLQRDNAAYQVPRMPGLIPQSISPSPPVASVQPLGMGGAPLFASAAPLHYSPPAVAIPPGLEAPNSYVNAQPAPLSPQSYVCGPAQPPPPPPPPQPTVHGVWALEAKFKADQAQVQQREWAESMQKQFLDKKEEPVPGAAFDKFVRQMGLQSETPRREGMDKPSYGQTPPSKQQASAPSTPPKADAKGSPQRWRKVGEKENLPSPAGSHNAALPRRTRGSRRAQAATYQ